MSAASVALIDLILRNLGPGWTYVLLAGIVVVTSPLLLIVMKIGPRWRAKRQEALERMERERS